MSWSTTAATGPSRCSTPMRPVACTRCSGSRGRPAARSTRSSTGQWTDAVVEVAPGSKALRKLRRKHPGGTFGPHRLRLVKYTAGGTVFILGTTLLDREKYRIEDLSNLYHGRWGIEELYKISKQLMGVDDFHGQSERGVKQELYAHFVLIALTRLFTNRGEAGINACLADNGKMQANFKNSLAVVARNIEDLLLKQAAVLSETVTRIVAGIAACRQRLRPNRSYERRSRKPVGKWQRGNGLEGRQRHCGRITGRQGEKPQATTTDSLSEWANPLSECHCPAARRRRLEIHGEEGRVGEVVLVAGLVEQIDARRIGKLPSRPGALANPADAEEKEALPGRPDQTGIGLS